MSATTQLVAVLTFLVYSAAYFIFVAWASERASGNKARLKLKMGFLLGIGIGLPLIALVILLRI
jgi:hypothetical protein